MLDYKKIFKQLDNLDEDFLCEFAFNRGEVCGKIKAISYPLQEHLIKCIVYGNSTNNLIHWVDDEIAEYFRQINDLKVKTQSSKLRKEEYYNLLTECFGEDSNDCLVILKEFEHKIKRTNQYPEFKSTKDMADKLYSVYTTLYNRMCDIFSTNNKLNKQSFNLIIWSILNKVNIHV